MGTIGMKQFSKIAMFGLLFIFTSCKIVPTPQEKKLNASVSAAISASKSGRLSVLIDSTDDFHSDIVGTFADRKGENKKDKVSDYRLNTFPKQHSDIVTLQEIKTDVFVLAIRDSLNYLNLDLKKLTISTSRGDFVLVNDFSGAGRFHWLFEKAGEYIDVQLYSATDAGIDGVMIYYLNN